MKRTMSRLLRSTGRRTSGATSEVSSTGGGIFEEDTLREVVQEIAFSAGREALISLQRPRFSQARPVINTLRFFASKWGERAGFGSRGPPSTTYAERRPRALCYACVNSSSTSTPWDAIRSTRCGMVPFGAVASTADHGRTWLANASPKMKNLHRALTYRRQLCLYSSTDML